MLSKPAILAMALALLLLPATPAAGDATCTVDAGGPYRVFEGTPFRFDGSNHGNCGVSSSGSQVWTDMRPLSVTTDGSISPEDAMGLSAEVVASDDGHYGARLVVRDGDQVLGEDTAEIFVQNLPPTVRFLPDIGDEVVLLRVGETGELTAHAMDPGADDLTFTWSNGYRDTIYTNETFPMFAESSLSLNAEIEGVTHGAVRVADDDGGEATAAFTVVTRGTLDCDRGAGWWAKQYDGKGRAVFTEAQLAGFLEVVGELSTAFKNVEGLDSETEAILSDRDTPRDRARATLLTAWLTFASGAGELEPLLTIEDTLAAGYPKAAAKMAHEYLESIPDCGA